MATPTENFTELAHKSINDIKELAVRVTEAVGKLDDARKEYQKSKSRILIEILKASSPIIASIILLFFAYMFLSKQSCGDKLELGPLRIMKATCEEPSSKVIQRSVKQKI